MPKLGFLPSPLGISVEATSDLLAKKYAWISKSVSPHQWLYLSYRTRLVALEVALAARAMGLEVRLTDKDVFVKQP